MDDGKFILLFMNPEESQNPKPIDEQLPTDQLPKTPSADLESEVEGSTQVVTIATESQHSIHESKLTETMPLEAVNSLYTEPEQKVSQLQQKSAELKAEIAQLEITYQTLQAQISVTQATISQVVQESLSQLEQRKQALQISVEQLERRQERIRNEMRNKCSLCNL